MNECFIVMHMFDYVDDFGWNRSTNEEVCAFPTKELADEYVAKYSKPHKYSENDGFDLYEGELVVVPTIMYSSLDKAKPFILTTSE